MPEVQKSAEVENALNAAIKRLHELIQFGSPEISLAAVDTLGVFLANLATV